MKRRTFLKRSAAAAAVVIAAPVSLADVSPVVCEVGTELQMVSLELSATDMFYLAWQDDVKAALKAMYGIPPSKFNEDEIRRRTE